VLAVDAPREVFAARHPVAAQRAVYAVRSAQEKLGVDQYPAAVLIGGRGGWVRGPITGVPAIERLMCEPSPDSDAAPDAREPERVGAFAGTSHP
jgi:hypothetical protein